MELPKRLFVVTDDTTVGHGELFAGDGLDDLPQGLLGDGAEVGIYLLKRIKKVEITRKLKAINGETEELDLEPEALPVEPEPAPG